jgi:UDP-N-acetyl-D-mannosaminuronic acid dehydrogenase
VSDLDIVVVGGAGHVGLPLALCFVDAGCRVGIYDLDEGKLARIKAGEMPFKETGGEELLHRALRSGRLEFSSTADVVRRSDTLVLVIGTPIDEFMNPSMRVFERVVGEIARHLRPSPLVILRSTVYPGTTEQVQRRLEQDGVDADVVFCPERVAEGNALPEIRSLPQLIGASTDAAFERARNLFARLDVEIIRTTPKEAELAKLLTNTWRYMRFAIANQFFEIAHRAGIDYGNVLHAIRYNYPRAADLPGPGLAAGPCLLKDTMQLAAFTADRFPIGQAAMLINEGLPNYIIDTLDARRPLSGRVVGILGMAFKAESDDSRTSLSYKLKKLAAFKGARVLCTDPYVRDPDLLPLDEVIQRSDILIVAAPHRAYQALPLDGQEVVDIWGLRGRGIVL